MARFLTTTGLSHHIENIINKAKINLYIVSPYLKISNNFLERLKDASARGVSITIVYGKTELKNSERTLLKEIPNLHVFYLERLHAKCYFNEVQMVITSMNMYEFSEKNNREMGVLIDLEKDNEIFEDAKNETLSIINHSGLKLKSDIKKVDLNIKIHAESNNKKFVPTIGNCISCKSQIKYDLSNPYCKVCKNVFPEILENPYKEEEFCHRCGKNISVSFHKPECKTCTIESFKPEEYSGFLITQHQILSYPAVLRLYLKTYPLNFDYTYSPVATKHSLTSTPVLKMKKGITLKSRLKVRSGCRCYT